ncbi:MAG: 4Fe-4S dicluster domain-containing protein [Candidatus Korobacteraceae bacterium]
MKKWHMIIDVSKCEDCNNCSLACKDEHVDNEWPGYTVSQPLHGQRWMDVARKERGQFPLVDVVYRPTTCMQCADAPCMKASHGAISRRDDGIVLIDPEKAKGQHELMNACPYGMIWWNEERQVPQKCTFCAHLLDQGWKEPRCVQACPTGALQVKCIEDSEMARIAASEGLECSHPEYKTDPQVYYANLQRFDRCFIGGSIAMGRDSTVDCATGAKVALQQGGQTVAQTTTDEFGDFRFDGLEPGSSGYSIDVQLEGFNNRTLPVPELSTSLSLGTIFLDTSDQHAG